MIKHTKPFNLLLAPELYEKIKEKSGKEQRSIAGEVRKAILEHCDD